MWTGQSSLVLEELKRTGRYVVKNCYVEQKYSETAWIFREAYQFLAGKAEERVAKPDGAESPVWVYKNPNQIHGGEDVHYLKLRIPKDKVLCFDSRKWNRILNLEYLGADKKDEERFAEKLRSRGIHDSLDLFRTAYYPLEKREVKKSWDRLLGEFSIEEAYLQGMTWEIREEWIEEL